LKLLVTLKGHNDKVNTVIFSPDGKTLVSGGVDNTIILWDITKETLRQYIEAVRFSRNGKIMVIAPAVKSSNTNLNKGNKDELTRLVNIFDITNSKITQHNPLKLSEGSIYDIALSSNGIYDIALSSNGEKMAIAQDTQTSLWDKEQPIKKMLLYNNDPVFVNAITWSSDGSTFATISIDNKLQLWNSDGDFLKILEKPINKTESFSEFQTMSFRFNPKDKILVSADKEINIILWKQEGNFISEVKRAHPDTIKSLEFSQDGKILVSGSNDGVIKLWSLDGMFTDNPYLTPLNENVNENGFKGHKGFIHSFAITPNQQVIASGGEDKVVRLWNLEGKEIISLTGHQNSIESLSFSPDGRQLFSVDKDKTMIKWSLDLEQLLEQSCQFLQDYNSTHKNENDNFCKS